jgi:predicted NodU family carbamoyl transferase
MFYAIFTNYLGFMRSEGEFKLMGMAALGKKNTI